tara:strand:+ start:1321 stop:1425 length:105 start_codon:yes stop_codon:yes gene_type:complete
MLTNAKPIEIVALILGFRFELTVGIKTYLSFVGS